MSNMTAVDKRFAQEEERIKIRPSVLNEIPMWNFDIGFCSQSQVVWTFFMKAYWMWEKKTEKLFYHKRHVRRTQDGNKFPVAFTIVQEKTYSSFLFIIRLSLIASLRLNFQRMKENVRWYLHVNLCLKIFEIKSWSFSSDFLPFYWTLFDDCLELFASSLLDVTWIYNRKVITLVSVCRENTK